MANGFLISLPTVYMLATVVFAFTVIAVRLRAAKKPVSLKKIVMPPLGMSTGFLMFLVPVMRIPLLWAAGAFLAGAVFFSIPLIKTSEFTYDNGEIYLKRSKAFIFILLALLAARLLLHDILKEYISVPQTGAVFFILAFGMLLPWRAAMFVQYRNIIKRRPPAA